MKRNKTSIFLLSVLALVGLSSCSFADAKGFLRDSIYYPLKSIVYKLMGKELPKEEEKKDDQKPSGEEGKEEGQEGEGQEGGGQEGGGGPLISE